MKTKKSLKLAVVLFTMIFAVGTAFAATNGMLAFGGTVRINSAPIAEVMRLEFTDVTHTPWDESILTVETLLQNTDMGTKRLQFDVEVHDIEMFFANQSSLLTFTIQNTGSVPVRFVGTRDYEMSWHPRITVGLGNGNGAFNGGFLCISSGSIYTGAAENFGIIEPGQQIIGAVGLGTRFLPGNGFIPLPDEGYRLGTSFELHYELAR